MTDLININNKIGNILLIDDDEITNFYHESILRTNLDFQGNIKVCLNGKDAIDCLEACCLEEEKQLEKERKSILILLDINMPVMNGFEFLDAYKQLNQEFKKEIVICMITSSLSQMDKEKAKQFDDLSAFISKPLEEDLLLDVIDKHFN